MGKGMGLDAMSNEKLGVFPLYCFLQEIMHDPQVCADGLTYEGRAIREWMDSGGETSPVTSLKLEHRNLTPNHALRFAIQDWLRHSHCPMKF